MISEKGFVLENGTELPFLGFGTYLVQEEKIILDALASGYRHIDTARRYENEKMVGNALQQCGIPRRELFLTSKVWKTDLGYDKTMASFEASLKDLQVQYLDLFLIHWPLPFPGADWKPCVCQKAGRRICAGAGRLLSEGTRRLGEYCGGICDKALQKQPDQLGNAAAAFEGERGRRCNAGQGWRLCIHQRNPPGDRKKICGH